MALEVGKAAPAFTLESTEGRSVSLKDFRERVVVLFFYPQDDTPTCTREACGFRDSFAEYQKAGAEVIGISPDDVASHHKFREKFSLPYHLVADPGHGVAEKYGVWAEKLNYGRKYMGIVRTTVVIDREGKVAKVFSRVRVDGHAGKVLEVVKAAGG